MGYKHFWQYIKRSIRTITDKAERLVTSLDADANRFWESGVESLDEPKKGCG